MLKRIIVHMIEAMFFSDPVIHWVDENYATTYQGSHRMSYLERLGRKTR